MMEATARQTVLHNTIYKLKKRLPLSAHDRRKSLYQAVSAHLLTSNSAGAAYLHCIKDGTNIDPPYNTGSDLVYDDDFSQDAEAYIASSGQYDQQGNKLVQNTESNGRYHTDWLNMLFPRLRLAKDLLSSDGVIFISIDDNEAVNLKKLCDEVFGSINYVGQITVVGNPRGRDYGGVARMHDYLFVYKKSPEAIINLIDNPDNVFPMSDELGGFELRELRNRNIKFNKENRPNLYYPFYMLSHFQ